MVMIDHGHEEVKTIKVIHEQQQAQQQYPAPEHGGYADAGVQEVVKTIKVIHEQQPAAGGHGDYSAGGHSAPAQQVKTIKVIHEQSSAGGSFSDSGFSAGGYSSGGYSSGGYADAGSSAGAGFDDTFETLKSLKVIGALSPNGGAPGAGGASYGGSFGGSYGGGAPSNSYLPPSGGWQ